MGKRCDCAGVLAAFESDPRLMCLPLAVRGLWLLLVRRMQALGQVALVLGSDIPKPDEVAMMVGVPVTELETHLVPLLARGLLVRRADGALECPLLAAGQKRAETSRINGLRGGRPRKDGSPPRQRELIMGVAGGLSGQPAETQAKPSGDAVGSVAKLASSPSEEASKQAGTCAVPADWQRVGDVAAEAAGFDPVRWTGTTGIVRDWLAAGADEALVVGVIRGVMERPNPPAPRHLGYFDKAVREAVAQRGARPAVVAVAEPVSADGGAAARAYLARFAAWQAAGMPGSPPLRQAAA